MFKVQIEFDEYEVEFVHSVPKHPEQRKILDPITFRNMFGTSCLIAKNGIRVVKASSDLSIKDNYSYNKGRKVSMAKALHVLFPDDKEKRLEFWKVYYINRGGKW